MFKPIWGSRMSGSPTIGGTNPFSPAAQATGVKPYATAPAPITGIQTLPMQDIFFSDQSFRAQLFRYLSTTPDVAWMFSYYRLNRYEFLDTLFQPNKAVMLITPVSSEEDEDNNKGQQDQQQQKQSPALYDEMPENAPEDDGIIDLSATEALMAVAIEDQVAHTPDELKTSLEQSLEWISAAESNPFAIGQSAIPPELLGALRQAVEVAITNQQHQQVLATENTVLAEPAFISDDDAEEAPVSKPAETILHLQQFFGVPLESELYQQLTEAYSKAKSNPEKGIWIRHKQDELQVLGQETPERYGYRPVEYAMWNTLINHVARFAAAYLDCRLDKELLHLPNGGIINTSGMAWQDSNKQPANIYQVRRLPNGKWFRVNGVQHQTTLTRENLAQVKQVLEQWNESLEEMGWLREMAS